MAFGVRGRPQGSPPYILSSPALTMTTKLLINATFIVRAGVELGGEGTLAVALVFIMDGCKSFIVNGCKSRGRELFITMQRPDIGRYHTYHVCL